MSKADLAHPELNADPIKLTIDGEERVFDINDPKLPDWIKDNDMASGGYPYADKMDKDDYEDRLERLQIELVKLQYWLQASGHRVLSLFEGRDAAGKGGTIFVIRQYMNPRVARNVALPKPTEVERGQWYYQRYIEHFPTAGEFVTFDRSWYNRAVVEPVMGFCTPAQMEKFLGETPSFERMIVNEGIHFFKFWLNIGQEMQLKRFHDRRHDPLKIWKFSPIDIAGMGLWDDYTRRRDMMMKRTHTAHAPWTVLKTNDKRRARLAAIRHILSSLPYDGRDDALIGDQDDKIVCAGPQIIGS
ncbi:polyphosphate kinase 2 [Nitratireductor sp. StC3]|uniref:polyphosphate kinase 2 n=1 Tax=Nitratireductor sp. StC3 TaxID=2126741 RepID=UPI000D0DD2CC|nr:polyphosphate kinase 2 [Nitratireductor sp. StC3]PSM17272.1 polyphosphate kinase 2 [Nitratireductor sp. StC3]